VCREFGPRAFAAAFVLFLAGCVSQSDSYQNNTTTLPTMDRFAGHAGAQAQSAGSVWEPAVPLQCVAFARARSGIEIYGDASTWWSQASGRFERGRAPKEKAVMVLAGYGGSNRAHVAVVHQILGEREISIDHANWLDDGAIYLEDPVADVSSQNDWNVVRVWNIRTQNWGARTYRVVGFIGPGPDLGEPVFVQKLSLVGSLSAIR